MYPVFNIPNSNITCWRLDRGCDQMMQIGTNLQWSIAGWHSVHTGYINRGQLNPLMYRLCLSPMPTNNRLSLLPIYLIGTMPHPAIRRCERYTVDYYRCVQCGQCSIRLYPVAKWTRSISAEFEFEIHDWKEFVTKWCRLG